MPDRPAPEREPSLWEVMAVDPAVEMDHATLLTVIRDQRSRSRACLYPWLRAGSRFAVALIVAAKRICPGRLSGRLSAHGTMDRLCLWFLRHFVSTDAVSLLIRHFVVESNLLNFCVANARLPGLEPVALRPLALAGLGDRAVIEHDLNVYRVLFALGSGGALALRRPAGDLDFGMLDVPPVDPEPGRHRLLRLDIQSALCLMNVPFALCLTPSEFRRAVHSLRLDYSLLTVLADLTGDEGFLRWRTGPAPVRVDSNVDVPAAVYEHALVCEHALARLRALRDAATGDGGSQARLPLTVAGL